MTETDVQIGVDDGRVVVDVETRVGAAHRVGARLQRTVISRLEVFLEHDVDDARRALSRELRRRIVNHLHMVDALRRQLLQNLRTVVGGQSTRLAVDPHLHARVAAQRHIAVVVHLHARDVLQRLRCRRTRIGHQLRHVERLAVHLQLHGRSLSCHRHLLQLVGVLRHVEGGEVVRAVAVVDHEVAHHIPVTHERERQRVLPVFQAVDAEMPFDVGHSALHQCIAALVGYFHIHETQRFIV